MALSLVLSPVGSGAQTVADPAGDVPSGDPSYVDLQQVRVRQTGASVQIDFYPLAPIPKGNQAGITTATIFEVYMDVDSNAATGARLADIGYDYELRVNLFTWNGKSWIDGNAYWGFDAYGNPSHQDGFFVSEGWLIPQRFRWEFSLISLKWSRVDWIIRIYYRDHWAETVPDSGHATSVLDPSLVPDIDTVATEYVAFVYPSTFQPVLDTYDVLHTVDVGTRIEQELCGTQFTEKPLRIVFNPWLNGVAYAGNPVMLGSWSWGSEPSWFIYFHELGHNFTLASERFRKLYPGSGYGPFAGDDWHFGTNFSESWATMVGLYAMHEMFSNPVLYNITNAAVDNLKSQFGATKSGYLGSLSVYESLPDFTHIYPDVVDAMLMTLADSLGYQIFPRWFRMLQPPNDPWPRLDAIQPWNDYDAAKITSMTITVCGLSVAGDTDFREMFRNRWDFPIYDFLYSQILPEVEEMINLPTSVASNGLFLPGEFTVIGNYPNPFNSQTVIVFNLPEESIVVLQIHDVLGRLIEKINAGKMPAGTREILYEASALATGVYIYTLSTDHGVQSSKMTVLN